MFLLLALAIGFAGPPLPPDVKPWPIGVGPGYRISPSSAVVRAGRPVGSLRCRASPSRRFGVHLEIFMRRRVVIIPAGIGVAKPFRLRFGRIVPSRCAYPMRTLDPTGVIEVEDGSELTLRDFFRLWDQPLGRQRIAGFRSRASVLVFVGGKRWLGDPGAVPLTMHAQIVLELGGYVAPHPRYLFSNGL